MLKRQRGPQVNERRRNSRVRFRPAVRGVIGGTTVFVLDVSATGLGVTHAQQIPPPGGICRVELNTDLGPIRLDCAIVHTVARSASQAAEAIFHSGLHVISSDRQSAARLQRIADSLKKAQA